MGGRGGSRISATLAFLLRSPIEAIVSPIEGKYFPTIFPFNLLLLGANPPFTMLSVFVPAKNDRVTAIGS